MQLIFATNNQHKVDEISQVLQGKFDVISLKEAEIDIDIPEPHDTLQENAYEKARTINQLTGKDCFSEDTGLEVTSLGGEPGVHSARYAGEEKSFEKNIDKLLAKLKNEKDRSAYFKTVICLILDNETRYFEGVCAGIILEERKGANGFGYDPVFVPEGSDKTFAEMDMDEKNKFSHRKRAVDKMVTFLKQYELNK